MPDAPKNPTAKKATAKKAAAARPKPATPPEAPTPPPAAGPLDPPSTGPDQPVPPASPATPVAEPAPVVVTEPAPAPADVVTPEPAPLPGTIADPAVPGTTHPPQPVDVLPEDIPPLDAINVERTAPEPDPLVQTAYAPGGVLPENPAAPPVPAAAAAPAASLGEAALLLRNPLTGRYYAVTEYTTEADGTIVADVKYDVTDAVTRLCGAAYALGWNQCDSAPEGVPFANPFMEQRTPGVYAPRLPQDLPQNLAL